MSMLDADTRSTLRSHGLQIVLSVFRPVVVLARAHCLYYLFTMQVRCCVFVRQLSECEPRLELASHCSYPSLTWTIVQPSKLLITSALAGSPSAATSSSTWCASLVRFFFFHADVALTNVGCWSGARRALNSTGGGIFCRAQTRITCLA